MQNFVPQIGLQNSIQAHKLNNNINAGFTSSRMDAIDGAKPAGFQDVMVGLAGKLNNTINAPDQVLQDAISGNGADIHDAVIAMSKAEIGINIATQVTSKIVQSYEKIMSIQV